MSRKIVFRHNRAIGDALMLTCGVRDFKLLFPDIKVNVVSNFPELWENNPYLDRSLKRDDPGVEYYEVGYPTINNCNTSPIHFSQAFLLDMLGCVDNHESLGMPLGEFVSVFSSGVIGDKPLGDLDKHADRAKEPYISIQKKYGGSKRGGEGNPFCDEFGRQKPDLYMTDEEKEINIVKEYHDIDKYWVIAPGGKSDCTCKIWDWRRFQDVINHFEGRLKFVVIGRSDHIVEKLDNVIDLTDKFNSNIRGLFSLVYNADGGVGGVSFLMHLAAGMPPRIKRDRKPFIGIYGGREGTTFTAYSNHQVLHTTGTLTCCDNGGCWQSRIIPLPKKKDGNKRLCHNTVMDDGRTIQKCMDMISSKDVIRAIERYYNGNIYTYMKPVTGGIVKDYNKVLIEDASVDECITCDVTVCSGAGKPKSKEPYACHKVHMNNYLKDMPMINTGLIQPAKTPGKEINVLASLKSKGGGEQSACKIVDLLRKAGWKVNFIPWENVHEDFKDKDVTDYSFKHSMKANMIRDIPLLFYANDQIGAFCREAEGVVTNSSCVMIGINYINSELPTCTWLSKSGKLKAIIFQNEEKRSEFERDRMGFEDTEQIVLYGAIELASFLEVCPPPRNDKDPLVILKHCTADSRKYVTESSVSSGDKIHLWQKNIKKELDTKFYKRFLKDTKNTRFEFMEAHPELINEFQVEPRMIFHKWNSMPVADFLSRGHIYLYRTSNAWRDNYPRVVAEALAVGLPVLSEPRDGTKDRMDYGNIGFSCIDYDGFLYAIKLLQRKEKYRYAMGAEAKAWARRNLDPQKWVDIIEEITNG